MKKVLLSLAVGIFLTVSTTAVFAGGFVQDTYGIKYDVGGGRFLENGWAWCDPTGTGVGYSYYFTPQGYILANGMSPDGIVIDAAGRGLLNGVPLTKSIEKGGYELNTASYPIYGSTTANTTLANRITSSNNARVTDFSYGTGVVYSDAIEFTEGITPYIMFNSGANTSLSFDLTGDNLVNYDGDFTMDVYANGNFIYRTSQRFVELTHQTISFGPNQNIEIRIPIINDYWEEYIRKIYIINAKFN